MRYSQDSITPEAFIIQNKQDFFPIDKQVWELYACFMGWQMIQSPLSKVLQYTIKAGSLWREHKKKKAGYCFKQVLITRLGFQEHERFSKLGKILKQLSRYQGCSHSTRACTRHSLTSSFQMTWVQVLFIFYQMLKLGLLSYTPEWCSIATIAFLGWQFENTSFPGPLSYFWQPQDLASGLSNMRAAGDRWHEVNLWKKCIFTRESSS